MVTQFEVHASQTSIHMKGKWSEGSSYEIKRKTQLGFYEILQRRELNMNVFHYFNEVDTLKELSSGHLVSWFKELGTRQGTLLQQTGFIF